MRERSSEHAPDRRDSALPLALFRVLFGACLAYDVLELIEYAPFWFGADPSDSWTRVSAVPLLIVWFVVAVGLMLGCFTRVCAVVNYACCVGFLGFTAMRVGYEYHLDNLYILASFGILFLPVSRVFSIDAWRGPHADRTVGPLPGIFLALVLSSIYLDSAVWKLSSRMWMEGLGYWVPASHPWDGVFALQWTLESEWVARAAGYVTLAYELLFVVLVWFRRIRVPLLLVGLVLHVGIGALIPLPLFGVLMIALLIGILPLRPGPTQAGATESGSRLPRTPVRLFFAGWAIAFALGMVEPVHVLARSGLGGVEGPIPRPWHVTSRSRLAHLQSIALVWSYRLFGFRSHPIFIDSQFSDFTVETRLRYHGSADSTDVEGQRFHPPIRNRRFVAWYYRMTWPKLAREEAQRQLVRFVAFHAARRELDLVRGRVVIEQRAIELPVTKWRAGQRARNSASPWRSVGVVRGEPGSLAVRWGEPCWR